MSIEVAEIAGVFSHDKFLTAGTSMVRVIASKPDGEAVIWQVIRTHPSPYSGTAGTPVYGAPAAYSEPSYPTPYPAAPPSGSP